ncbi:MAG: MBL fold metallo-hydrolase, partial [Pseudomonadota bacterium]
MPHDASYGCKLTPTIERLPADRLPLGFLGLPINAYALLGDGFSILVDAPFMACMDALCDLERRGFPPWAMVLTGGDIADLGDGYGELAANFGLSFHLHRADHRRISGRRVFRDLPDRGTRAFLGMEIAECPATTRGAVLIHLPWSRGLFIGDHGGLPRNDAQDGRPARLCLPEITADLAGYLRAWRAQMRARAPDLVLPSQGPPLSRNRLGGLLDDVLIPD